MKISTIFSLGLTWKTHPRRTNNSAPFEVHAAHTVRRSSTRTSSASSCPTPIVRIWFSSTSAAQMLNRSCVTRFTSCSKINNSLSCASPRRTRSIESTWRSISASCSCSPTKATHSNSVTSLRLTSKACTGGERSLLPDRSILAPRFQSRRIRRLARFETTVRLHPTTRRENGVTHSDLQDGLSRFRLRHQRLLLERASLVRRGGAQWAALRRLLRLTSGQEQRPVRAAGELDRLRRPVDVDVGAAGAAIVPTPVHGEPAGLELPQRECLPRGGEGDEVLVGSRRRWVSGGRDQTHIREWGIQGLTGEGRRREYKSGSGVRSVRAHRIRRPAGGFRHRRPLATLLGWLHDSKSTRFHHPHHRGKFVSRFTLELRPLALLRRKARMWSATWPITARIAGRVAMTWPSISSSLISSVKTPRIAPARIQRIHPALGVELAPRGLVDVDDGVARQQARGDQDGRRQSHRRVLHVTAATTRLADSLLRRGARFVADAFIRLRRLATCHLGMENLQFTKELREQINDLSALNYGENDKSKIEQKVRDGQRTPMQWIGKEQFAGFTDAPKPYHPLSL